MPSSSKSSDGKTQKNCNVLLLSSIFVILVAFLLSPSLHQLDQSNNAFSFVLANTTNANDTTTTSVSTTIVISTTVTTDPNATSTTSNETTNASSTTSTTDTGTTTTATAMASTTTILGSSTTTVPNTTTTTLMTTATTVASSTTATTTNETSTTSTVTTTTVIPTSTVATSQGTTITLTSAPASTTSTTDNTTTTSTSTVLTQTTADPNQTATLATTTTVPAFTPTARVVYVTLKPTFSMYSLILSLANQLGISPALIKLEYAPSVAPGAYGVYIGRDWASYTGNMTQTQIDAEKAQMEQKIGDLMSFNDTTWGTLGASLQGLYSPNLTSTTTVPPYAAPASGVSVGVAAVGFIIAAVFFIAVIVLYAKKKKLEENQLASANNNSMVGGYQQSGNMSPGPLGRHEMEMARFQQGGGMHTRPQFDKNNLDPTI